jgi:hypothetical protein
VLEKNEKRPRVVAYCASTGEHAAHDWNLPDSTHEGWRCRGIDRAEGEVGGRATDKAVKKARRKN